MDQKRIVELIWVGFAALITPPIYRTMTEHKSHRDFRRKHTLTYLTEQWKRQQEYRNKF
jgi:hypothetical protein